MVFVRALCAVSFLCALLRVQRVARFRRPLFPSGGYTSGTSFQSSRAPYGFVALWDLLRIPLKLLRGCGGANENQSLILIRDGLRGNST